MDDTEGFAEKFKYLVCSSGMLEKDFVKPLTAQTGGAEIEKVVEEVESSQIQQDEKAIPGASDWRWCFMKVTERWDIGLAGGVLLGAFMVVLGWKKVIMTLASLIVGVLAAEVWQRSRGNVRLTDLSSVDSC
jgi:hypothetical protein